MRWAIIQLNSRSADIRHNAEKIRNALKKCSELKVDLLITPELPLLAYPTRDLLSLPKLVEEEQAALLDLKEASKKYNVALLISHVEERKETNEKFYNSASLFDQGLVLGTIRKVRLPNYDIFDECRFFQAYNEMQKPLNWRNLKIHVSICEDAWQSPQFFTLDRKITYSALLDPMLPASSADIMINLSASPFYMGKISKREELFAELARKHQKPFVYADSVGAQDDLLFDGGSFALNSSGQVIAHAKHFEEELLIFDVLNNEKVTTTKGDDTKSEAEVLFEALKSGIRDYVHKSGFKKVHLGVSGGMDSALVCVLCKEALGKENVLGIALPSAITSNESKDLARKLCDNIGIAFKEIPISNAIDNMSSLLKIAPKGLSYENLQARIRGLILMALSNQENSLLISTGNKSELAMGYSTLYGDLCGALNPVGDLYKSDIYALSRYLKSHKKIDIPEEIFTRAPSAELAPDQKDQDSLPSYEILDSLLFLYIEAGMPSNHPEILNFIENNKVRKDIFTLIHKMEFKRYQSPPILKTRFRSFGSGWRFPINSSSIN